MKLHHYLFFTVLLLASAEVVAQCPSANINLSSQTDVDNFPAGCTAVAGNLTISETSPGSITDLSPLAGITSIGGRLLVFDNTALTTLSGLDNIVTVTSSVRISKNPSLTNLNGLGSLNSVSSFLEIDNNSGLVNVGGISGSLVVNGRLIVEENALLENLNGLSGVTQIGSATLEINDNAILSDIGGLNSIDPASVTDLVLTDNTNLAICEEPLVCTYLSNAGSSATVSGNAVGCESRMTIEDACLALPVTYSSFTAVLSGKNNDLNWDTDSEENNNGFHVEHSSDGYNWVRMGFVAGSGRPDTYNWTHQQPSAGTNYYRLLQEDFDGALSASSIEIVYNSAASPTDFMLYPNPAYGEVRISGVDFTDGTEVRVLNSQGQVVLRHRTGQLFLGDITPGLYFVEVRKGTEASTKKLIVK